MKIVNLVEAMDYEAEMLKPAYDLIAQRDYLTPGEIATLEDDTEQDMAFCHNVLKRQDRIVWFLKLVRIWTVQFYSQADDSPDDPSSQLLTKLTAKFQQETGALFDANTSWNKKSVKEDLAHYLSLPVPKIQEYKFGRQDIGKLFMDLGTLEQEWKATLPKGAVQHQSTDEVVLDCGSGWFWVNLNRAYCSAEAEAMGHCGNSPRQNSTDVILSLRKGVGPAPHSSWQPSLTFILDEDGMLTEMKGRGNDKPSKKYFPQIIKLLRSPMVKGIKGGGYKPENNFSMTGLPDDIHEALVRSKPALGNAYWYMKLFGADETFWLKLDQDYHSMTARRLYDDNDGQGNVTLMHYNKWTDFNNRYDVLENAMPLMALFDIEFENSDMPYLEDTQVFGEYLEKEGIVVPEEKVDRILTALQKYAEAAAEKFLLTLCTRVEMKLTYSFLEAKDRGLSQKISGKQLALLLDYAERSQAQGDEDYNEDEEYTEFDENKGEANVLVSSDFDDPAERYGEEDWGHLETPQDYADQIRDRVAELISRYDAID